MLEDFQAFQLASEFYQACKSLKMPRFLKDQLNRASASVALNLAEGSGKFSPLEQRRYYGIALGSMRECEAVLHLEKVNDENLKQLSRRLGAILFKLAQPDSLARKP
jgi:four helix bundle protein